eukprot:3009701-Amphidinium_carterae.1
MNAVGVRIIGGSHCRAGWTPGYLQRECFCNGFIEGSSWEQQHPGEWVGLARSLSSAYKH